MELKKLGSSDLDVSIVCLGTMTWGVQTAEEEAHAQLDLALSLGVNFIDTAELYPVPPGPDIAGRTERFIGNWLEKTNTRDKVILATKVSGRGRDWINNLRPGATQGEPTQLNKRQIHSAVDASLGRLKTSYIDLIYLHWPDRYVPMWGACEYNPTSEYEFNSFEEQVQAVGELLESGKARYWGLSNETTFGVVRMAETAKRLGVPPPIAIQNDFSLVDRRFESELAEACAPSHYNIGLLPYGPLAGGTLSGKYLNGHTPSRARHMLFPEFQPRYHGPPTMAAIAKYAALAKKHSLTPTLLALAFCKSRWYVTSTVIGATTLEQLKENIEAFKITLSADVLKEIDAIHLEAMNPNCNI